MIKTSPVEVWKEYQKGRDYKDYIELYDNVRTNENFYNGNQWEGLNAPDLPKPTLNFLKRVVNFISASIMSDDIAVGFTASDGDETKKVYTKALSTVMDKVIENTKLKSKLRYALRDALVDGDACIYARFNPDIETGQDIKGDIEYEVIDNINVYFGNPYTRDVQSQPYIIIAQRKTVEQLKDEAETNGVKKDDIDMITPDDDDKQGEEGDNNNLVTKLIKLWIDKKTGTIWCAECTEKVTIRKAFDTGYKLYPLAWMTWDHIKSSYHGQAILTGLIQNQIQVNRLFAMTIRSVEMNAFPKVIYDPNKIKRWTNAAGEALKAVGGAGAVNDAYSVIRGGDVSNQVMEIIDKTISMTKDFMGASDTALGNVKPENTSAIIAVSQSTLVPLQLNRLDFYQFAEDLLRSSLDIMRADYGTRTVYLDAGDDMPPSIDFDFGTFDTVNYDINVDIGAGSYWSEITKMQTMDNLFARGLIADAVDYLESVPKKYISDRDKLVASLKKRQEQEEAIAQAQLDGAEAGKEQARLESDPNAVAEAAAADPNIQAMLSQIGG